MIDLLSSTQILLKEAGFQTRLRPSDAGPVICFEDDAFMGFCCVFEYVEPLIEEWRGRELQILRVFSSLLRGGGDKAWNVYCAFLTSQTPTAEQARQIRWIEEDLERTRKIAAAGIVSREDLVRVFLPLLPLQYQPQLQVENPTERLKKRIQAIAPGAADAALDPEVNPAEVVRLIGGVR